MMKQTGSQYELFQEACYGSFVALRYSSIVHPNMHSMLQSNRNVSHSVDYETFVKSMDLLEEINCRTLTGAQLGAGECVENDSDTNAAFLTFDDGWVSDVDCVLPVLAERNLKATFFIPSGLIGKTGRLSWRHVTALSQMGMEIGSHTVSHAKLTGLVSGKLTAELLASRNQIEDALGQPVSSLAVPMGYYDQRVIEHAWASGYTTVFTSDWGINVCRPGESLFKRCAIRRKHRVRDVRALLSRNPLLQMTRETLFQVGGRLQQRTHVFERKQDGLLALPQWLSDRISGSRKGKKQD